MLEYLFVCSKRNTFMGTETSKNPLLFLYYQGSLFPFFWENAGELRFIALEREKWSPYNSHLTYGDQIWERGSKDEKLAYETN